MPESRPNTRFSDCWSSVGDVTFYHRNGRCFWRSKSKCRFKGTAEQMRTAEVHSRALAAWRELPHSVQLRWNEYAREVPSHRPPFDGRRHITGHNLFVSAYHGFAQMGNEHVPEPVKWQPFPVFAMEYARCESATGDSLKLRFRLSLPDAESPERYRVLAKVQVGKPGCGKDSSKMRNVLSESVPCDEVSEVTFFVSSAEIYAPPFQIHMRYLLLDTKTGYRSQYVALSTLVSDITATE